MRKPHSIIIVLDARAIVLILLAVLVIGWAEGYRRRGDLMRVEAQNARIIELLEGAEITQVPSLVKRVSTPHPSKRNLQKEVG